MQTQTDTVNTAERLREARKSAGLTQKQMSLEMNIPIRTIEDWERGKRVPPEWLVPILIMLLSDSALRRRINN